MVEDSWQADRPAEIMNYERYIVQVKLVDEVVEVRGMIRKRVDQFPGLSDNPKPMWSAAITRWDAARRRMTLR